MHFELFVLDGQAISSRNNTMNDTNPYNLSPFLLSQNFLFWQLVLYFMFPRHLETFQFGTLTRTSRGPHLLPKNKISFNSNFNRYTHESGRLLSSLMKVAGDLHIFLTSRVHCVCAGTVQCCADPSVDSRSFSLICNAKCPYVVGSTYCSSRFPRTWTEMRVGGRGSRIALEGKEAKCGKLCCRG
jgi:hypothetical protein